jgi:hypothetical protein
LRKKAGLNQDIARRRMCLKYNNKKGKTCFDFSIGDKVSVKVDKLDRISLDLKRIPGVVSAKSGDKDLFFSITTEFGILETKYRAYELEKYYGALNFDIRKISQKILCVRFVENLINEWLRLTRLQFTVSVQVGASMIKDVIVLRIKRYAPLIV